MMIHTPGYTDTVAADSRAKQVKIRMYKIEMFVFRGPIVIPRRFRSYLDERGPARHQTAGFTHCAPRRTYPRRKKSGAETPQRVPGTAPPTRICALTPSKCRQQRRPTTTTFYFSYTDSILRFHIHFMIPCNHTG